MRLSFVPGRSLPLALRRHASTKPAKAAAAAGQLNAGPPALVAVLDAFAPPRVKALADAALLERALLSPPSRKASPVQRSRGDASTPTAEEATSAMLASLGGGSDAPVSPSLHARLVSAGLFSGSMQPPQTLPLLQSPRCLVDIEAALLDFRIALSLLTPSSVEVGKRWWMRPLLTGVMEPSLLPRQERSDEMNAVDWGLLLPPVSLAALQPPTYVPFHPALLHSLGVNLRAHSSVYARLCAEARGAALVASSLAFPLGGDGGSLTTVHLTPSGGGGDGRSRPASLDALLPLSILTYLARARRAFELALIPPPQAGGEEGRVTLPLGRAQVSENASRLLSLRSRASFGWEPMDLSPVSRGGRVCSGGSSELLVPFLAAYVGSDSMVALGAHYACVASAPAAAASAAATLSRAHEHLSSSSRGGGSGSGDASHATGKGIILRSPVARMLRKVVVAASPTRPQSQRVKKGKAAPAVLPSLSGIEAVESSPDTLAVPSPVFSPLAWAALPYAVGLPPLLCDALSPRSFSLRVESQLMQLERSDATPTATIGSPHQVCSSYAAAVSLAAQQATASLPPPLATFAGQGVAVPHRQNATLVSEGHVTDPSTLLAFLKPYLVASTSGFAASVHALRIAAARVHSDLSASSALAQHASASRDSLLRAACAPDGPARAHLMRLLTTLPRAAVPCLYVPLMNGLPYITDAHLVAAYGAEVVPDVPIDVGTTALDSPALMRVVDATTLEPLLSRLERLCPLPLHADALVYGLQPDPRARVLGFALRLAHLLPAPALDRLESILGEMARMVHNAHQRQGGGGTDSSPAGSEFVAEWPPGRTHPAGLRPPSLARGGRWLQLTQRSSHFLYPCGHLLDDAFAHLAAHGWLSPLVLQLARAILDNPSAASLVAPAPEGPLALLHLLQSFVPPDAHASNKGGGEAVAEFPSASKGPSLSLNRALRPLTPKHSEDGADTSAQAAAAAVAFKDVVVAVAPPARASPLSDGKDVALTAPGLASAPAGDESPAGIMSPPSVATRATPSTPPSPHLVTASTVRLWPTRSSLSPPPPNSTEWDPSPDAIDRSIVLLSLPIVGTRNDAWLKGRGLTALTEKPLTTAPLSSQSGSDGSGGMDTSLPTATLLIPPPPQGRSSSHSAGLLEGVLMDSATVRDVCATLGPVERVELMTQVGTSYVRDFWGKDLRLYNAWLAAGAASRINSSGGGSGGGGGMRAKKQKKTVVASPLVDVAQPTSPPAVAGSLAADRTLARVRRSLSSALLCVPQKGRLPSTLLPITTSSLSPFFFAPRRLFSVLVDAPAPAPDAVSRVTAVRKKKAVSTQTPVTREKKEKPKKEVNGNAAVNASDTVKPMRARVKPEIAPRKPRVRAPGPSSSLRRVIPPSSRATPAVNVTVGVGTAIAAMPGAVHDEGEEEEEEGGGAEVSTQPASGGGVSREALAALFDASLASRERRKRTSLAGRVRRFNLGSELHALVTFKTPAGAARASSPALRHFGIVVGDQACPVLPARSLRSLRLRGFPSGLRHNAVALLLADILEGAGFDIPPPPMLQRTDPRSGPLMQPVGFVRHTSLVTMPRGDTILTFQTFDDALRARAALEGLRVGRHTGNPGMKGLWTGGEVVAAVASPAVVRAASHGGLAHVVQPEEGGDEDVEGGDAEERG